jgi:hypothetical protein
VPGGSQRGWFPPSGHGDISGDRDRTCPLLYAVFTTREDGGECHWHIQMVRKYTNSRWEEYQSSSPSVRSVFNRYRSCLMRGRTTVSCEGIHLSTLQESLSRETHKERQHVARPSIDFGPLCVDKSVRCMKSFKVSHSEVHH